MDIITIVSLVLGLVIGILAWWSATKETISIDKSKLISKLKSSEAVIIPEDFFSKSEIENIKEHTNVSTHRRPRNTFVLDDSYAIEEKESIVFFSNKTKSDYLREKYS